MFLLLDLNFSNINERNVWKQQSIIIFSSWDPGLK